MPTAGSGRGTTEIECPSALEITVRLLAHRSHSQKYCRDASQCLDCAGEFKEFASLPFLPASSTKSLPPRKYRKAVSQDGFAHFVTMNQTSGKTPLSNAIQSCRKYFFVDSRRSTRSRGVLFHIPPIPILGERCLGLHHIFYREENVPPSRTALIAGGRSVSIRDFITYACAPASICKCAVRQATEALTESSGPRAQLM